MNAFDIVLIDDQTMDVPLALLEVIENFHKRLQTSESLSSQSQIVQ